MSFLRAVYNIFIEQILLDKRNLHKKSNYYLKQQQQNHVFLIGIIAVRQRDRYMDLCNYNVASLKKMKTWWNPVYCSWSTNNRPPPYFSFLFIFCFYCYFMLGQVKIRFAWQGQDEGPAGLEPPAGLEKVPAGQETHAGCPAGLGKRFDRAPQGQSPPQGLELKKIKLPLFIFKKKSKISGGGVIFAPRPKHGIVPKIAQKQL